MTDQLILHGMGSPNVTKVVIMLEECGLDYELRHVAVFGQEQFSPAFLALNPLGKVPVLEDPRLGIPLAESGAILHYLAEREGKFLPAAQPATQAARAEVMQWLMVQMANIGPMLGQVNHFRLVMKSGTHPYAEGRYVAAAEEHGGKVIAAPVRNPPPEWPHSTTFVIPCWARNQATARLVSRFTRSISPSL